MAQGCTTPIDPAAAYPLRCGGHPGVHPAIGGAKRERRQVATDRDLSLCAGASQWELGGRMARWCWRIVSCWDGLEDGWDDVGMKVRWVMICFGSHSRMCRLNGLYSYIFPIEWFGLDRPSWVNIGLNSVVFSWPLVLELAFQGSKWSPRSCTNLGPWLVPCFGDEAVRILNHIARIAGGSQGIGRTSCSSRMN